MMVGAQIKRIEYLDNLKFFAILCVIIGHCSAFVEKGAPIPYLGLMNDFIDVFNMPLFMLVSGFLSYKAIVSMDDIAGFKQRVLRMSESVVLPSFFFTFFYILYKNIFCSHLQTIASLAVILGGGAFLIYNKGVKVFWGRLYVVFLIFLVLLSIFAKPAYFWYMTMYMQVSFFVLLFSLLYNGRKFLFLFGAVILFLLSCYFFPLRGIDLVSAYMAGALLKRYWPSITKSKLFKTVLFVCCIITGLLLFPIAREKNFYVASAFDLLCNGEVLFFVIRQICYISMSISFFMIFYMLFNRKSLLTKLGSRTLYLYMYHAFFLSILRRNDFVLSSRGIYPWLSLTAMVICVLIISVLFDMLIQKSRILSLLLIGKDFHDEKL